MFHGQISEVLCGVCSTGFCLHACVCVPLDFQREVGERLNNRHCRSLGAVVGLKDSMSVLLLASQVYGCRSMAKGVIPKHETSS